MFCPKKQKQKKKKLCMKSEKPAGILSWWMQQSHNTQAHFANCITLTEFMHTK